MIKLHFDEIDASLSSANRFLHRALIREGNVSGFPEVSGFRKIRPWGGTSDGLLALFQSGEDPDSEEVQSCAKWMYENQDPHTGGWESRDIAIVDSTAMAIIALATTSRLEKASITRAVQFLLDNRNDGGFSPLIPQPPRVFTTCLSIWALSILGENQFDGIDTILSEARDWLLRSSRPGGGWGFTDASEDVAQVPHTGCALFALSHVDVGSSNAIVHQAVEWLLDTVQVGLTPVTELHRVGKEEREIRTIHLCQPWVLLGLIRHGIPVFDEKAQMLIAEILHLQDSDTGGFRCPIPGEEERYHIWATSRCVHALRETKKLAHSSGNLLALASDLALSNLELERLQHQLLRRDRIISSLSVIIVLLIVFMVILYIYTNTYTVIVNVAYIVRDFANEVWRTQGWAGVVISLLVSAALAPIGWLLRRFKVIGRLSGFLRQLIPRGL